MLRFFAVVCKLRKLEIKGKKSKGKKSLSLESADEPDFEDDVSNLGGSDIKLAAQSTKGTKHTEGGKRNASMSGIDVKSNTRGIEQAKGKERTNVEEPGNPSSTLIALWRRGDYDLEPSAKMLALIDFLQSWDGDKTICYSQ